MVGKRFHFITGLPRSGSSLLSALLNQNPRFHASITSPVAGLLHGLLDNVSARSEFYPMLTEEKRRNILRGVVENYHADVEEPVVFDTNRSWSGKIHVLRDLFPGCKLIACVRPPPGNIEQLREGYQAK